MAVEADRIESFTQGSSEIQRIAIEDAELTKVLLQVNAEPDSLTKTDRDRAQHWMVMNYLNFRRIHRAYQSGLLPVDIYETERAGVGFSFSSEIGSKVIEAFSSSNVLDNEVWEIVRKSANQAQAYCLDSQNVCLDRYITSRGEK
jgi:hypothetical protein